MDEIHPSHQRSVDFWPRSYDTIDKLDYLLSMNFDPENKDMYTLKRVKDSLSWYNENSHEYLTSVFGGASEEEQIAMEQKFGMERNGAVTKEQILTYFESNPDLLVL